jgi:hypothetical protein
VNPPSTETALATDPPTPDRPRSYAEAYLDPYRPLPPVSAPATGSADPRDTELARGEEPITTGTLFLTIILLMIIGGIWVVAYGFLLNR